MHILMLTASLPYPPASGGAIRTYGIIKGLYETGHQITLLSFAEDKISQATTPLAEYCARIITCPPPHRSKWLRLRQLLLSAKPDIAYRFYSVDYELQLRKLLAEHTFDLIQFEAIEIACYLPLVRQLTKSKICFDTFNAEAELQRAIFQIERQYIKRWPNAVYSFIQSKRIFHYEALLCRLADCVLAVSPEDAGFLAEYRQDERTYIIPSGIFVDDYTQKVTPITLKKPSIVFTGKMDYRPNIDAMLWFTKTVWTRIIQDIPSAHLYIVGQKPHPSLAHLTQGYNVTLTGWVDDVRPYLQNASLYVAPLRMGSGTRLKLLEAMASGCPIVATAVAASGLRANVCEGMMIANDAQDFIDTITYLLSNHTERERLGQRGQQAVRITYDWSVIIPNLLKVYKEIGIG